MKIKNLIVIISVTPVAENKNEETYFKEFMKRDNVGIEILNKELNNNLPVFYNPVSIIYNFYTKLIYAYFLAILFSIIYVFIFK